MTNGVEIKKGDKDVAEVKRAYKNLSENRIAQDLLQDIGICGRHITFDLKEGDIIWIYLAQDKDQW
jgi:chemotaxis receptor (MCP) glutamine deamidase CheD